MLELTRFDAAKAAVAEEADAIGAVAAERLDRGLGYTFDEVHYTGATFDPTDIPAAAVEAGSFLAFPELSFEGICYDGDESEQACVAKTELAIEFRLNLRGKWVARDPFERRVHRAVGDVFQSHDDGSMLKWGRMSWAVARILEAQLAAHMSAGACGPISADEGREEARQGHDGGISATDPVEEGRGHAIGNGGGEWTGRSLRGGLVTGRSRA